MPDHRPRYLRIAVACLIVLGGPAGAQAGLHVFDDASLAPRGLLRLRMAPVWTRYDQRFGRGASTALGAPFTSSALGAAHVPELSLAESLVQGASASPFSLSLGSSRFDAVARDEHLPFTLEYGVSSRLSVTVMMPVIRRRVMGLLRVDSAGANMGPNPRRRSATATSTNALVQSQFALASGALQAQLDACGSTPAGPGCAALLPRQAEAQQLIQESRLFAARVDSLYGSASGNGEAFVPRTASAAQAAVAARVSSFNLQYQDLLASTATWVSAVPVGASGPAGSADLEQYVTSDLDRDSIATQQLLGIGDAEVGARMLLVERRAATPGALGLRLVFAAAARLPTGSRRSPVGVADLRVGQGVFGGDARVILDAQRARFGILLAGSFTTLGSNTALPPADSRHVGIDVAPRWHVSAPLAFHGVWSLRDSDLSGARQSVGGGVTFTTVERWAAGQRPLPMEMRFTHIETTRGDAGVPRVSRDLLEVRVYYRRGR